MQDLRLHYQLGLHSKGMPLTNALKHNPDTRLTHRRETLYWLRAIQFLEHNSYKCSINDIAQYLETSISSAKKHIYKATQIISEIIGINVIVKEGYWLFDPNCSIDENKKEDINRQLIRKNIVKSIKKIIQNNNS